MKHATTPINGQRLVGLDYINDANQVIGRLSIVEVFQVHGDPNDNVTIYDCVFLETGETLKNCVESNAAWFVHCLSITTGGRHEQAQARLNSQELLGRDLVTN